ncbi:hypothetical protein [Chryseolinea lacunae]|uniref:Vitellogenin domain-containing protein n=1 Tax=Chryseolinea lacunae TaxID=2801331 RepID=A0ABS1KPA2_9BACT|nr:hypothetical protein [Chryseolinea lacunae]MBL0740091.1 hypothetical protein [Chryseolinea lacunae]
MTTRLRLPYLLSLLFIAAVSTPVLSQDETATSSSSSSVSVHSVNGVQRWKTSTGLSNFNVEVRGKIEVTDDDKDIKGLSDNGYLEITKTVFGSKRSIVVESLGGGKIKKEYYEGRNKMDWETSGKTWLGEILPEIVRSTTLGAEGRVNRFFKQGGSPSVLKEINGMESDYVKAHYAKLLLDKSIPPADMPNVITQLASAIHSDYYLSTVLQNNITKMMATPESADAFFKGTQKINSDYYKSVVLKEALKKVSASPAQIKVVLQSAAEIKSDYYLSVVLTTLLEEDNLKEESLSELVLVSKKIPSDYYRTQVLSKALRKPGISKATLKNVVNALADVGSDYYKTGVFNTMAEQSTMDPDVQMQVVVLLDNSVESDYYASGTMKNLLEHQKLSDESFKQLIDAAGHLESANYASEVMRAAARTDLSRTQLIDILIASGNVRSDHYLTEVLLSLAGKVKTSDSTVKDAYRSAAKKIGSETYYGRTMKAID